MDTVDSLTRSRMMSRIRSRGNHSTERRLRAHLVRTGVRGWTLHSGQLPGRPDFVFTQARLIVFVDGCFWHGCSTCIDGRSPRSNTAYWSPKILGNQARDRRVTALLRRHGWRVVRVWEHEISASPDAVLAQIQRRLVRRTASTTARN